MIDDALTKVGLAGALLGAVWLVGMGIDRAGGHRITDQGAAEGALLPEVAVRLEPTPAVRARHTALVALSLPQLQSIEPGSVRAVTAGYTVDAAQIRPVLEYRKPDKPRPRSIMLVLDNSKSMTQIDTRDMSPPSDPEYRRLDACRRLLGSLSEEADRVSLAIFPCRITRDTLHSQVGASFPFELLAQARRPSEVAAMLDTLRGEENYTTPLYEGMEEGAKALGAEDAGRQRVMVLLTDGKPSKSDPEALARAVEAVRSRNIDAYGIALGSHADESTLRQFAPHVLRADDADALDKTFKEVMEQISREVVQVDLDVVVGKVGKAIPPGQPVEIEFRSNGKLYRIKGKTK